VAYDRKVPVNDFRYLVPSQTLDLDWQDPWYSKFENKALKRWQQSGMMTFLYIEPFEVRHETLVRVKDMEAWLDLGLRGDEFIEVDEFDPLKKKIGEFLLQHSKVQIDGVQLRPILDRTSFVKYTMIQVNHYRGLMTHDFNLSVVIVSVNAGVDKFPGHDLAPILDTVLKRPELTITKTPWMFLLKAIK